eukprot:gnl/TRDRNA2_/TRDRNA2_196164_c0_seq1.p1 gnl/TRDRNA2_/TRDRNA2_196164_c0~~gnl/TRDRNA2_/TRDRNA2_196164_c0_seq1.p1  ORF type:complete len:233 (+),score=32.29 gnl/TRDRNA2_/TRDRNA2_196164_c0_seq1:59-757(+)
MGRQKGRGSDVFSGGSSKASQDEMLASSPRATIRSLSCEENGNDALQQLLDNLSKQKQALKVQQAKEDMQRRKTARLAEAEASRRKSRLIPGAPWRCPRSVPQEFSKAGFMYALYLPPIVRQAAPRPARCYEHQQTEWHYASALPRELPEPSPLSLSQQHNLAKRASAAVAMASSELQAPRPYGVPGKRNSRLNLSYVARHAFNKNESVDVQISPAAELKAVLPPENVMGEN